jgi:hypothetical protein
LKPWILEVNLSPSLDCDALLDVRIKSQMVSDLLTLTGIHCQNPSVFSNKHRYREQLRFGSKSASLNRPPPMPRPHSAHNTTNNDNNKTAKSDETTSSMKDSNLSQVEQSIVKSVLEEMDRSTNWIRLFPSTDTWEFYSQFLETRSTSYNQTLHKALYPRRWQNGPPRKNTTQLRPKILENFYFQYTSNACLPDENVGASMRDALERYNKYESKLNDSVKPNHETLKRVSSSPHLSNLQTTYSSPNLKSNLFPNGDSSGSNKLRNDDINDFNVYNNNNQSETSTPPQPTIQPQLNKNKKPTKVNNNRNSLSSSSNNITTHQNDSSFDDKNNEIKYDLDNLLKLLNDGYYIR